MVLRVAGGPRIPGRGALSVLSPCASGGVPGERVPCCPAGSAPAVGASRVVDLEESACAVKAWKALSVVGTWHCRILGLS